MMTRLTPNEPTAIADPSMILVAVPNILSFLSYYKFCIFEPVKSYMYTALRTHIMKDMQK